VGVVVAWGILRSKIKETKKALTNFGGKTREKGKREKPEGLHYLNLEKKSYCEKGGGSCVPQEKGGIPSQEGGVVGKSQ